MSAVIKVALGLRRAHAVARIIVDPEQYRILARRRRLQPCRHFHELPRIDAPVVRAGDEKHGRIRRAVLDVLIRIHRIKSLESIRVLHRTEFGNIGRPVRAILEAQRIHHAHFADGQRE